MNCKKKGMTSTGMEIQFGDFDRTDDVTEHNCNARVCAVLAFKHPTSRLPALQLVICPKHTDADRLFFTTFGKANAIEFSTSARKRPSRSPKIGFQKANAIEFSAQKSLKKGLV